MSANPNVKTHPLLFAVVQQHVTYYYESQEYTSRSHIESDLRKDSQYLSLLEESGINFEHPNARSAFRSVFWHVARQYMKPSTGWWARSRGTRTQFFHEDWGTPEDLRDAINLHIADREHDQRSLRRLVEITETKCGQLGWSLDQQFSESGELAHVETWKYQLA